MDKRKEYDLGRGKSGEAKEREGDRRERREKKDRRKRERNVVWRGVEERCFVEEIMTMLGRVAERKGEAEKWILITELKEITDKEEVLDRRGDRTYLGDRGGSIVTERRMR